MWKAILIVALFVLSGATARLAESSELVEAPRKAEIVMVKATRQVGGARLLAEQGGKSTRSPFGEDDPSGRAARVNSWYAEHPEYAPKRALSIGDPVKPQPTQPPKLEVPRSTPVVVAQNEYHFVAKVTGYSSSVDETDDTPFITASNTVTRHGVVANNCLPLGTEIELKGLKGVEPGIYRVEDTKNARFGCGWIDVWRPSKQAAREVGTQNVIAHIVKYGKVPNPRAKS